MRAKEYLLQYRRALERIRQIEDHMSRLYLQAEVQANAPKPDIVRGSGKKQDRTGDIAVKIAEASARLDLAKADSLRMLEDIASVIDAVGDPIQSRILYDRYIANMSWYDIAEDIGYDATHTRGRLHGAALEAVRKILEERHVEDRR